MTLQLGALRNALIDAGASIEKAEQAAEELASYENRFASLEQKLVSPTWLTGFNLLLTAAVLTRLLNLRG
jgi:hypothetical protein